MQLLQAAMNEKTEIGDYTVVRLNENNVHDLTVLDNVVYGKNQRADYYLKKYNTAYTGKQYIGYIAYNNNIPLAYYGVIPVFLEVDGKQVLAAQSADSMTHPAHQSRGLYTQLSKLTFALCIEEGVELVFGFPNQNSYKPAVTKTGWKETGWMDAFTIEVNAIPLAGIARRLPLLKKLYTSYKTYVLKKYSVNAIGIQNSAVKEGWYGVSRNDDYLQYKTYNNSFVLQVGNSLTWVSLRNGFLIGDIILQDDFNIFITGIKKIAKQLGIARIQFVISRGTNLHSLFAEKFTAVPAFPVLLQTLNSTIAMEKFKFTYADIDVF